MVQAGPKAVDDDARGVRLGLSPRRCGRAPAVLVFTLDGGAGLPTMRFPVVPRSTTGAIEPAKPPKDHP
jgi:hypothetical protein